MENNGGVTAERNNCGKLKKRLHSLFAHHSGVIVQCGSTLIPKEPQHREFIWKDYEPGEKEAKISRLEWHLRCMKTQLATTPLTALDFLDF